MTVLMQKGSFDWFKSRTIIFPNSFWLSAWAAQFFPGTLLHSHKCPFCLCQQAKIESKNDFPTTTKNFSKVAINTFLTMLKSYILLQVFQHHLPKKIIKSSHSIARFGLNYTKANMRKSVKSFIILCI